MKKVLYILLLSISFVLQSCKNTEIENLVPPLLEKKTNFEKDTLKQYISTIYIPYLLKEDIDSINVNKEKFINDKEYRWKTFEIKARERHHGIRQLSYTNYKNRKVPYYFKKFLLPNELALFHKDSISKFVTLYELYKKRRSTVEKITRYNLEIDEIQHLIQVSFKDSVFYKKLASNRFKTDSIKSWRAYNQRTYSLQSIIHPIDSILPFGPETLGELIRSNQNDIGFTVLVNDLVRTTKDIEARKTIYNTWEYFLRLHPYADADLSEDYEQKLLPPIKSYQYVMVNDHSTLSDFRYVENPSLGSIVGSYVLRLPDINKYEVYYTTTGTDGYGDCGGGYNKTEENCCFTESWLGCNSTGNILLYDRKEQHSIVIAAFALNARRQERARQQFFYIDSNYTIHVFNGDYYYNRSRVDIKKSSHNIGLTKAAEIKILEDGKAIMNAFCLEHTDDRISNEKEKHHQYINRVYGNTVNADERLRDSIVKISKPLINKYPFGDNIINKHELLWEGNIVSKKTLDSITVFYNELSYQNTSKSLPVIKKINQVNIGLVESWDEIFTNRILSTNCYAYSFKSGEAMILRSNFKLPKIGLYEVFYVNDEEGEKKGKGVLVLYNANTLTANVINVLEHNDFYSRRFLINKNSQIEIYQGLINENPYAEGESSYKIDTTHIVEVLSNGEIKVTQQN